MRYFYYIMIFIIAMFIHLYAQNNDSDQITVTVSNPAEQGFLEINHYKGSIRVTGYDGDVIIVHASLRYPSEKTTGGESNRTTSNAVQLTGIEKNNHVIIHTNSRNRTIDLRVEVPVNFSLKLQNYDNGDITVHNINGEIEISNINGDITLTGLSGSAVLNSVEGDITANFEKITPGIPMAFTTMDGKIDLTFPTDVNASLKLKSENGEIFTDFKMDIKKRAIHRERSVQTGNSPVIPEEWTYGKINDGGPEYICQSYYGNIYIRKGFNN